MVGFPFEPLEVKLLAQLEGKPRGKPPLFIFCGGPTYFSLPKAVFVVLFALSRGLGYPTIHVNPKQLQAPLKWFVSSMCPLRATNQTWLRCSFGLEG